MSKLTEVKLTQVTLGTTLSSGSTIEEPVKAKEAEKKVETPVTPVKAPYKSQFDSTALSILKKNDVYFIIKVEVDSELMLSGKVTVLHETNNKAEANEFFKIQVVKHGII